jgi:hypothetical protein
MFSRDKAKERRRHHRRPHSASWATVCSWNDVGERHGHRGRPCPTVEKEQVWLQREIGEVTVTSGEKVTGVECGWGETGKAQG